MVNIPPSGISEYVPVNNNSVNVVDETTVLPDLRLSLRSCDGRNVKKYFGPSKFLSIIKLKHDFTDADNLLGTAQDVQEKCKWINKRENLLYEDSLMKIEFQQVSSKAFHFSQHENLCLKNTASLYIIINMADTIYTKTFHGNSQ